MKITMYQNVPEEFHRRLMDTLETLPEEEQHVNGEHIKIYRRPGLKKWLVIGAAAVLALGSMTVAATEIFKWREQAKERFGVSDELEDELTMSGVTRPESTVVETDSIDFELLQSVRTGNSCYYLCEIAIPEGIAVDEDTIFESFDVEANVETDGMTANLVWDEQEENRLLLEIEIFLPEGTDCAGQEAVIHMSNLVRAPKTEVTEILLKGNWELPVTLLGETEQAVYEVNQRLTFGTHEVLLQKVQAGPFGLRLYMEEEEARHGLMYTPVSVTGIRDEDGSLVKEDFGINRFGRTDEATGEFYFEVSLEQAVNPGKMRGIVFNDGELEIDLLTGQNHRGSDSGNPGSGTEASLPDVTVTDEALPEQVQILYQRNGYEIITDGEWLYIHDMTCGTATGVLELSGLDYSQEKGGEIVPFSTNMAYILPYEGCDTVYIYGLTAEDGEHLLSAMPAEETLESESYQLHREAMLKVRDGKTAAQ